MSLVINCYALEFFTLHEVIIVTMEKDIAQMARKGEKLYSIHLCSEQDRIFRVEVGEKCRVKGTGECILLKFKCRDYDLLWNTIPACNKTGFF